MEASRRFINEIKAGETLDQVFLVTAKELRTTRKGDLYVTCTLCDKTGQLPARMWQANETIFGAIPSDGFLHVKGRVEDYKGSLQFIIDACRPYPKDKVDLGDFLAVTQRDVDQMWTELLDILRGVKDKPIRRLIKKFVEDQDFVAAYKRAPAAMQMHHPFIGGLLEHTLNVARAARQLLPMYPKINADLVLAGVFFHDMGKAAELATGTGITYTDRGQLIGHITIAAIWLAERAAALAEEDSQPFPQQTLDLLQHIVLSHHGIHEYGSPKLPMIPEAYMIHYLDNLDAKMFMTVRDIENDPDPGSSFTPYNRELQVRLYKRSAKLPKPEDQAPGLFEQGGG
ncbi:MAG: HD domain-containing protein [Phycisphaerae bacterium]